MYTAFETLQCADVVFTCGLFLYDKMINASCVCVDSH